MSNGNPKSISSSPSVGQDPWVVALEYFDRFGSRSTNTTSLTPYIISKTLPAISADPRTRTLLSNFRAQIRNLTLDAFGSSHSFPTQTTFLYGGLALHLVFFRQDEFAIDAFLHMIEVLLTTFLPIQWTALIASGILILEVLVDYGWPVIQG